MPGQRHLVVINQLQSNSLQFQAFHASGKHHYCRLDRIGRHQLRILETTISGVSSCSAIIVDDVALVPYAGFNLMSLGKLDKLGNANITMLGTNFDLELVTVQELNAPHMRSRQHPVEW